MGRAARLAVIGALAISIALPFVIALASPAPRAPADPAPRAGGSVDATDTLRRCRTVTQADPACAAAWDEKRRRFFRQEKDET